MFIEMYPMIGNGIFLSKFMVRVNSEKFQNFDFEALMVIFDEKRLGFKILFVSFPE